MGSLMNTECQYCKPPPSNTPPKQTGGSCTYCGMMRLHLEESGYCSYCEKRQTSIRISYS